MIVSFLFFMVVFVAVGLWSFKHSRGSTADYYLASQSVQPWLVGLSAVATNNSGYMFIGVIGYTYHSGLEAVLLMVGWLIGDGLGALFVHKRLHNAAVATGQPTLAGVLSHWYGDPKLKARRLLAVLALVFLLSYAAAQLVAGSKALSVLLGWPIYSGAIVGAIMVLIYCLAGGIRASIWTDAAQSVVMIGAMSVLLWVSTDAVGGVQAGFTQLSEIPGYLYGSSDSGALSGVTAIALFIGGWLVAGLSVIGQPHIMVRFMTLEDNNKMLHARIWYYVWFVTFYCMATGVGLLSRLLIPEVAEFDAELALPTLAMQMLPGVLVGLILAGIFAATMSTADSLILACSSTVSCDLLAGSAKLKHAKWATVFMTSAALVWALASKESVFQMVVMAWSGLAGIFAPLLILLALGREISQRQMMAVAVVGLSVALAWRFLEWHTIAYEGVASLAVALALGWVVSKPASGSDES